MERFVSWVLVLLHVGAGAVVPVFNKCCNEGEVYWMEGRTCVRQYPNTTNFNWSLPVLAENQTFVRLGPREFNWTHTGEALSGCGPGFDYEERLLLASNESFFIYMAMGYVTSILIRDEGAAEVPLNQFCLDRVQGNDQMFVARMCAPSFCYQKICYNKCCREDESLVFDNEERCEVNPSSWNPQVHKIYSYSAEQLHFPDDTMRQLRVQLPCSKSYWLDAEADPNDAFYLNTEGQLYVPRFDTYLPRNMYCLERVSYVDKIVARICDADVLRPSEGWSSSPLELDKSLSGVYSAAAIASQICLLITFIVYLSVRELRNLHGKTVLSHVFSLYWAFFFLTIVYLGRETLQNSSKEFCQSLGLLTHYFFMAAFFWLSVISYDLWRSFGVLKSTRGSMKKSKIRFIVYSIYAWGSPLIISTVTMVMEFSPSISPFYPKPYFAHNSCWFVSRERLFMYFLGPMAAVLLANVIFFTITTARLFKLMKETKELNDRQEHRKSMIRFLLYVKLLVVMGVTWILEVIPPNVPVYLWYVFDILNLLQGVFLFIIFVCKRKVFKLLKKHNKFANRKWTPSVFYVRSGTNNMSLPPTPQTHSTSI